MGTRFPFVSPSLLLSVSLSLCLSVSVTGSIQTESLEKQAISLAQGMSASDLDPALPDRSFASWFSEVIGTDAGVVWQLTECGQQIVATGETGPDLPACAEVNANLPDGRKVFVVIRVGTFKQGLTGKPTLFRAIIEQNDRFHQVRRLSDLTEMLGAPEGPSANGANLRIADKKTRIAELPTIKINSAWIIAPFPHLAPPSSRVPSVDGDLSQPEAPPATPPATAEPSTQTLEKVPESVTQSRAITRVKPVYPPTARKMNATGTVEVEITISEAGLVVEATAISGHMALRSAAVDAARKWVFNPAILNGAPVRVKSVLTFIFAPSAR